MASTRSLLLAVILAAGCRRGGSHDGAERWPPLPTKPEAAQKLVESLTARHDTDSPDDTLDDDALMGGAFGPAWNTVTRGSDETRERIQAFLDGATSRGRDAYVLFGTFHDSAGQIDAFRRLIGPGGLADPLLVPLNDRADVAALVDPDGAIRASVDRVHEPENPHPPVGKGMSRVGLQGDARGQVVLGLVSLDIGPDAGAAVDLSDTADRRYSVLVDGVRFAGVAHLAEGAELTLRFDATHRSIAWSERGGPR